MSAHPRWHWLAAAALPIALLLPFIAKPYHMDDPLFLWLAQHIQNDPVHFFAFDVNWHQSSQPMYEVTMNPPGAGYLIAAAATIVGWTEPALHAVFLLIAAAAALGTFALARQCCAQPLLATALTVLSPVFLVSSTNLMSDTLMLALYTWAIALWMRGVKSPFEGGLRGMLDKSPVESARGSQKKSPFEGGLRGMLDKSPVESGSRSQEKSPFEGGFRGMLDPAATQPEDTPQKKSPFEGGFRGMSGLQCVAAALLIALGFLVKYLTITLIPLLAAYTLFVERKLTPKHLLFLIPIATAIAYHVATLHLFGRSMIFGAAAFSTDHATGHITDGGSPSAFMRLLVALAFTGGCAAPVLVATAIAGKRFDRIALAVAFAAALATLFLTNRLDARLVATADGVRWSFVLQASLWIAAGATLLLLAARELYDRRDSTGLLLCLWIAGIVTFTAWINWTINGRTLLPLVPAVGILLVRRFESNWRASDESRHCEAARPIGASRAAVAISHVGRGMLEARSPARIIAILAASAALALTVTYGDYRHARAQKTAAQEIAANLTTEERPRLTFQGHWGFQYYMQQLGIRPFDRERGLRPGDHIVIPENSPSLMPVPEELTREIAVIHRPAGRFITTMHRDAAAGFYSHFWGPLPFTIGPAPKETFRLYEITTPN